MSELDTQADLQRRFGGLERLYGVAGAAAIRVAHVAVVGVGGVGSWAAEALARSGVGEITLIDLDHVAESNINRQIHALSDTVGQAKVQAMRDRIGQIHPRCTVHGIEEFVEPDNWPQLLPAGVDAVIDACDAVRAKQAMAAWALRTRSRFISVGAAGGKRSAHAVDIDKILGANVVCRNVCHEIEPPACCVTHCSKVCVFPILRYASFVPPMVRAAVSLFIFDLPNKETNCKQNKQFWPHLSLQD